MNQLNRDSTPTLAKRNVTSRKFSKYFLSKEISEVRESPIIKSEPFTKRPVGKTRSTLKRRTVRIVIANSRPRRGTITDVSAQQTQQNSNYEHDCSTDYQTRQISQTASNEYCDPSEAGETGKQNYGQNS